MIEINGNTATIRTENGELVELTYIPERGTVTMFPDAEVNAEELQRTIAAIVTHGRNTHNRRRTT